MNNPRSCGCKGCRTCLICEKEYNFMEKEYVNELKKLNPYTFCVFCNKIYPGWNVSNVIENHEIHNKNYNEKYFDFDGISVILDFITVEEEEYLINSIDEMKWDISQSGRRKQNFGPKVNFKKTKLANGEFNGFPKFSKFLQEKFKNIDVLEDFQTIEQCSLEYDPKKGASIDPHIDDCWIWGERIVTVNLLSDSVLTLNLYKNYPNKYNLHWVSKYQNDLKLNLKENLDEFENIVIRVPMPRRSLIVMYGPPRYQWQHSVLREDIKERRVCIAYREFTKPYLFGGDFYEAGKIILKNSVNFWDHK